MTNETEITTKQPTPKRIPWRGIGIIFSTFAVIVLLFIFFVTNYFYLNHMRTNTQNSLTLLHDGVTHLEQQLAEVNHTVTAQEDIINTLRQTQTGFNRDQWRMMEAEFLTKLANDKG